MYQVQLRTGATLGHMSLVSAYQKLKACANIRGIVRVIDGKCVKVRGHRRFVSAGH